MPLLDQYTVLVRYASTNEVRFSNKHNKPWTLWVYNFNNAKKSHPVRLLIPGETYQIEFTSEVVQPQKNNIILFARISELELVGQDVLAVVDIPNNEDMDNPFFGKAVFTCKQELHLGDDILLVISKVK